MEEFQAKLKDLANPSGRFVKDHFYKDLYRNVPEALLERHKIKEVDTVNGFELIFTDLSPAVAAKVKEWRDSLSGNK